VLHERTGLIVPVDDPAALAEALVRLLRDRALAERLGEEGRRHG
jgi:glycosyltransferase involved in cell wall biosynthesis